nr:uncharacterized protein LOC117274817 isoform X1 [Nicotiana tomentosiformis]
MVNAPSGSRMEAGPTPLVVRMTPHGDDVSVALEDERFPMVEEIILRSENKSDFSKLPEDDSEASKSMMNEADLAEFRAKSKISAYINLIPAGCDVVQIHHLGYRAFYAYPFFVGYSFPLLPLAEEFCRYYGVCPAQLSPYVYKLIRMLAKYAELAGRGVSLRHLMHLFAPSFYREMMLHLRHRGSKSLVVKMDDKANRFLRQDRGHGSQRELVA